MQHERDREGAVTDAGPDGTPDGAPAGGVVDRYGRALGVLRSGDHAAAGVLLERAIAVEPGSPALREALGRARFGSRRRAESAELSGGLVDPNPADPVHLWRAGR